MEIKDIISKLTLEEKALLLTGGGALKTTENKRLGIPKIEMSDGPHGIRRLLNHPISEYVQKCNIEGGDVCFPTASAMGSSWNKELVREVGQAIAQDCIAEDIQVLLAPGVNMKRTPLCGRNFEYFSEDPILSGKLGAAFIKGVEGEGVATSLKHFALNNQEIDRSIISVEVDERTLREYYLKAFEIIVKDANPKSVMCAYNKVGGIWCSENKWLLDDILRKEWNYEGLVVSDWHAVHSPAKALAAGMELQMPKNPDIINEIKDGISKGIISENDVNFAVEKILQFIFDRKKETKKSINYDRKNQHQIAKKAALEGITLLKNEDHVLPITQGKYKKIGVFGTFAEEPVIQGGGSSKVTVDKDSIEKPLDFIRNYTFSDTEVIYEPLYHRITTGLDLKRTIYDITKEVDLSIVFIANEPECETEGIDKTRLTFSEYMNDCVNEISKSCENTIVVMQTGSCTAPDGWQNNVKGILQMWYGGEAAGSAIAEILFGIENPSGKLSETFITKPRNDINYPGDGIKVWYQEGMFVGYRYYDKYPEDVWYPFGHGLSYTEFEYSDLVITPTKSENENQKVQVKFKVKNTGKWNGKEVVQLYVGKKDSIVLRPDKELQAFEKITLMQGEEQEVVMELDARALAYYNTYLKEWHVESGVYEIKVGASSTDIRLTSTYYVSWEKDYTGAQKNDALIL